jgi:hypothetical protein
MLLILHLKDLPADAVNFCDLFSHAASLYAVDFTPNRFTS